MALDTDNFRSEASKHSRASGKQFWKYDAGDDLLATVLADDFFLTVPQNIGVGDVIVIMSNAGVINAEVLTSTVAGITVEGMSVQALSGPGAIDTIAASTDFTSTGVADALTLIDGAIGQKKTIVHVVDGGSAVLTPTSGLGYTTITFTTAGEAVHLEMHSGGWAIIGFGGLTATLPAVA